MKLSNTYSTISDRKTIAEILHSYIMYYFFIIIFFISMNFSITYDKKIMWSYVWLHCNLHVEETSVFRVYNKLLVVDIVLVLILMVFRLVSFESHIWLPGTVLEDFAEINGFLLKRLIGRGIFCSICNVHRATAVIRRRQIDFNVSIVPTKV